MATSFFSRRWWIPVAASLLVGAGFGIVVLRRQDSKEVAKELYARGVVEFDGSLAGLIIDASGVHAKAPAVLWVPEELEATPPSVLLEANAGLDTRLREHYGAAWIDEAAACRKVSVLAEKLLDLPGVRLDTYEPFRVVDATSVFVDVFLAMDLQSFRRAARSGPEAYGRFEDPGRYHHSDEAGNLRQIPGNEVAGVSLNFVLLERFVTEAAKHFDASLTREFERVWDSPVNLELVRAGKTTVPGDDSVTLAFSVLLPGDRLCWKHRTGLLGGPDRKGWRALVPASKSLFETQAVFYRRSLGAQLPTLGESDEMTIVLGRPYVEAASKNRQEREWPEVLGIFRIPEARRVLRPGTYVLLTSGKNPGAPRFAIGLQLRQ